jgi:SAM-dependent methyltransferase
VSWLVPGTAVAWLPVLVLAWTVLAGLRLNARARRLRPLAPSSEGVVLRYRFVTALGVELDVDTRRAASAYATAEGLDVLDLVPADLPTGRAGDLLRAVDPARYRGARLAPGRGAFQALLVDVGVAERAGLTRFEGLDPVELAALTVRLKRYAAASADLAVAPGLRGAVDAPEQRRAVLTAVYGAGTRLLLALPPLGYAALLAGAAVQPVWGVAALLAFCAQPYLVFAGAAVRPRDLHRAALGRLVLDPLRWARTVAGRWRPAPGPDPFAGLADEYAAELAAGTDRFFEPRRDTCPWCGADAISVLLRTGDLIQRKPGRFTLERCGGCGHTFQNPRLSLAGLDFYYRDFYDRLGAEQTEFLFGTGGRSYRGRAELVTGHATPRSWLDVGAGHGHFCNVARDTWPDTVFDGLDMSESIEEAQRRRWVDRGHRGMFPDLAGELAGRYDVVSMHHYLEHTREPLSELDAARKVLHGGGHLLIEVPNPESLAGRVLGRFWVPWFQPQHQHLVPIGNLVRALEDRGFTVVATDRGRAHQPADLTGATALLVNVLAPAPNPPWRPGPPSRWRAARHHVLLTAALPVFALTVLADQLLTLALRRGRGGNTYRVLACVPPDDVRAVTPPGGGRTTP